MTGLRQHQAEGAAWLSARPKAYLADAPRVGKTRTLIAGALALGARRPMVVCPAIVRTHWQREAEALGLELPLCYSYDALMRGGETMRDGLLRTKPDVLILDEAHYVKHAEARRTKLLLGVDGYARRLERVWPASGTPMPRHPGELWTIMAAVFPEVARQAGCRTYEQWLARWTIREKRPVRIHGRTVWQDKVVGISDPAGLRQLLDGIMLRRTLDDLGVDVPPLDWQVLTLDESHYRFTDPTTAERVQQAIAEGRLHELVADPYVAAMRRKIGELKAAAVVAYAQQFLEDAPDEKLVLLAHHRDVLEILRAGLQAFGVAYIDGSTAPTARTQAIDTFQHGAARVFLGQTIACQTGITLSAARTCLLVEPDWTAVVNEQAGHRIMDVTTPIRRVVQFVALAGTLDEVIVRNVAREGRQVAEVMA